MMETVRLPGVRWVLVVTAAVGLLVASYQLLLPHGQQYPEDHGRAQLATLALPTEWEEYYPCLIGWAEDHGDELWIADDFILEPIAHRSGEYYGRFRIRASGVTGATGGFQEGGLWVTVGLGKSLVPFGRPCGSP